MSITKITTPELLDFPNDSISSANTSGTVIPKGYTSLCKFPNNNTILLYEFENNTNDSCGNYNATTTNAITYGTGKIGDAAEFDGSSSYIEYANFGGVLNTANAFSYSFWAYFNSISTYDWVIGVQQAGSPYAGVGLFGNASNKLGIAVAGAGPQSMTGTLSLSTWTHIAFTHDGNGNYKCYVDGGTPITYSGVTSSNSANPLRLGYSSVGGWNYLDGDLDQVRIYNTQLSSQEVTELYNEGTTTPSLRPTTNLSTGEFRYNEQLGYVEYYDSSNWQQIADEYISGQPTSCVCNYPTNTTPIALYQLDNLNDTCGSWSNATNVGGATFTSGKFGNALTLNGSSQWLELLDIWTYSNNFSCSVWVYIHSFTSGGLTNYPMVLGFWGSGSYAWFIELNAASTPEFNAYMYGPALRVGSTSTLTLNTWYHIVFTTSSTEGKKFYLNGVLEEHHADTQDATTTTAGGNWIGQSTSLWANDAFDGQIDQLRFYNSVLTQTQITELYNEVVCN